MNFAVLFLFAYLLTRLLLPLFLKGMAAAGLKGRNWRGEAVFGAGGLIIPLVLCLSLFFVGLFSGGLLRGNKRGELIALLAVCTVSLLGFYDDLSGNSASKGLRGHFSFLCQKRRLTSGLVKVVGIGLVSLGVVILRSDEVRLIDWLLLVLSANFINLLDVRPGRALKGFAALFLFSLPVNMSLSFLPAEPSFPSVLFALSGGIALAYAPYDLRGWVMLGDIGANTLGFLIGLAMLPAPFLLKVCLVSGLLLVHLLAEKYSFNEIIIGNRILARIDRWGRGEA